MANNLKFTISAVDRTKRAFSGIKKGLGSVTSALFNFKTAIAGAVGVGGIGLLVKNSLEATDRIGKLSGVLGISTKDLQTFKLASEIGGIELETFAKGVRRFTDNIGDFKIGVGEAKVSFEQLGITTQDVLAIENDQVALLGLVADKLNKVEDGAIKTKLAIEIFGGRGAELINVLDGGTDALIKFAEESQRFGSLTSGQVKAVENFNDSVVRLKTAFFNIVNQIVANLSPAFQKFSDFLTDKLVNAFGETEEASMKFAQRLANSILDAIEFSAKGLVVFANNIIKTFNELIAVFNKIPFVKDADFIKKTFVLPEGFEDSLKEVRDTINQIGKSTESVFGTSPEKIKNTTEQVSKLEDRLKRLQNASDQFGTSISQGFEKAILEGQRLADTLREIGQEIIRIALRKTVTEPGGEFLGGLIKTGIGSILKGIGGSSPVTGVVRPGFRSIGGSVKGGSPYVVGEKGAELFIPGRSGTIVPNNAIGSGAVTVNQTINLMPSVTDSVRGEILNALPLIREQSVQAVIEARSRGGVMTKAMGLK